MGENKRICNRETSSLVKFSLHDEEFKESEKETASNVPYLMAFQSNIFVNSLQTSAMVCRMNIHPVWGNYLALALRNSSVFRYRFCCWLLEMLWKVEAKGCDSLNLCEHCSLSLRKSSKNRKKSTRINVQLESLENNVHNLEPEIKWSIRILPQVFQHLQLEAVFAWLSTLGGAHSALGDYFSKHAEMAWHLSVKQLYIALKIGDPVLAAHCRLFMSISMMQRGQFSEASRIIRSVNCVIRNDKRLQEKRLMNCCKAARVRLKYIQQEQKKTKNGIHS